MSNCNYNKQTANQRGKASVKKRVKKNMGGSMNPAMSDMGMQGGAMYEKGGPVKKKSKFPDHSGDGKITKKDILMAKGIIPKKKNA